MTVKTSADSGGGAGFFLAAAKEAGEFDEFASAREKRRFAEALLSAVREIFSIHRNVFENGVAAGGRIGSPSFAARKIANALGGEKRLAEMFLSAAANLSDGGRLPSSDVLVRVLDGFADAAFRGPSFEPMLEVACEVARACDTDARERFAARTAAYARRVDAETGGRAAGLVLDFDSARPFLHGGGRIPLEEAVAEAVSSPTVDAVCILSDRTAPESFRAAAAAAMTAEETAAFLGGAGECFETMSDAARFAVLSRVAAFGEELPLCESMLDAVAALLRSFSVPVKPDSAHVSEATEIILGNSEPRDAAKFLEDAFPRGFFVAGCIGETLRTRFADLLRNLVGSLFFHVLDRTHKVFADGSADETIVSSALSEYSGRSVLELMERFGGGERVWVAAGISYSTEKGGYAPSGELLTRILSAAADDPHRAELHELMLRYAYPRDVVSGVSSAPAIRAVFDRCPETLLAVAAAAGRFGDPRVVGETLSHTGIPHFARRETAEWFFGRSGIAEFFASAASGTSENDADGKADGSESEREKRCTKKEAKERGERWKPLLECECRFPDVLSPGMRNSAAGLPLRDAWAAVRSVSVDAESVVGFARLCMKLFGGERRRSAPFPRWTLERRRSLLRTGAEVLATCPPEDAATLTAFFFSVGSAVMSERDDFAEWKNIVVKAAVVAEEREHMSCRCEDSLFEPDM